MNKILEMEFGSSLYGTRTPNSDLDYKAIYLPTAKEIVLGNYKRTIAKSRPKSECERNTKDDIDIEIFSLDRYLELLMQGQTVALDILFGFKESDCIPDKVGYNSSIMQIIYTNRDKLLTKNVNAFVGYAKQQAAKYGIKGSRMDALKRTKTCLDKMPDPHMTLGEFPLIMQDLIEECSSLISLEKTSLVEIVTLKGPKGLIDQPHLKINGRSIPFHAKVKYAREVVDKMLDSYGNRAKKAHLAGGIDWKALSHAVRVNSEALELLSTGRITFPRPDREMLLNIKLGNVVDTIVYEMIEQGLADLYEASEKSTLRETPDKEWADEFIYQIYSGIVKTG